MKLSNRLMASGAAGIALAASAIYVAAPGHAATTIKVTEKQVTFGLSDAAPKGFSVGDTASFYNTLTNTSDGTPAGYDTVQCVVERVLNAANHSAVLQCFGTVRLQSGTITVQGNLWQNNTSSRLAVTGGTGAYEGAQGNLVVPPGQSETTKLTITLR